MIKSDFEKLKDQKEKKYRENQIKLKEWERRFEEERQLEEKREDLKAERIARKQQERTISIEEKENIPEEELVSRLESFETKHSKKN